MQLAEEMATLREQVTETIGYLREETEVLGGQLAERGRRLREETEELRDEVGVTARQLMLAFEALNRQVAERGQRLRGEVEAWSGLLPHMA